MVDIDAAVGFVVARGDAVDRARLSHLRTGALPPADVYEHVEMGQATSGGWPAQWAGDVASVEATCFRLAELDDLDGLTRPAAKRALDWLAARQRLDGWWEEDAALAAVAPPWARPGDPEARFYLSANAAFWLAIAASDAADEGVPVTERPYEVALTRASRSIVDQLGEDGSWPGFLVSGWLAAAVLHRTEYFYESARMFVGLAERVPTMSAADAAWMALALRRAGVSSEDRLLVAARRRLDETQRPDGGWPSDDAPALDVHTTLTALRALR
jgi:hypothetical protein